MNYVKMLLIAWASFVLIVMIPYIVLDKEEPKLDEDRERAFQDCLQDVTNRCGDVISYASALEIENAKLNARLKEVESLCTVTR